jgi:hypothetical protein
MLAQPPHLLVTLLCTCCITFATSATPEVHVKIFSIYGDDPAGQQGIVNVRLNVQPYTGTAAAPGMEFNWSSIDDSHSKYNMSSFIDISNLVWQGRSGVQPGWQANIAATVQAAHSRLAGAVVAGVFLGDEIVCGGVHVENLTAVAAFCKQQLVSIGARHGLVYVNECKPSFTKPSGITGMIPAGLDIISFDSYELANETSFAPTPWWLQEPKENKAFAKAVIVPKLHPHQKLMVVPGFYGNDTATAAEHVVQDERLLAKLEAYWTWIKDDEEVVGLNPYHWVRSTVRSYSSVVIGTGS